MFEKGSPVHSTHNFVGGRGGRACIVYDNVKTTFTVSGITANLTVQISYSNEILSRDV